MDGMDGWMGLGGAIERSAVSFASAERGPVNCVLMRRGRLTHRTSMHPTVRPERRQKYVRLRVYLQLARTPPRGHATHTRAT